MNIYRVRFIRHEQKLPKINFVEKRFPKHPTDAGGFRNHPDIPTGSRLRTYWLPKKHFLKGFRQGASRHAMPGIEYIAKGNTLNGLRNY